VQSRGLAAQLGDAGLLAVLGDDGDVGEQQLRIGALAMRLQRRQVMRLEGVVVVQEDDPFAARHGQAAVAAFGGAVGPGALQEAVGGAEVAGDDGSGFGVQGVGHQQDLEVGAALGAQRGNGAGQGGGPVVGGHDDREEGRAHGR